MGFEKQNLEVQKNVNSENLRVLKKNWFHWTKSADKVIYHVGIRTPRTVGLAKLTASLLTNLDKYLSLAVEGFGDLPNLPFSEDWVKRMHIPATENGIGLKNTP